MIRAGELRHRIELQEPSSAQDEAGQAIDSWTTKATVWAAVNPISGREYFAAEKANNDVSHRILIRHYAGGITPRWRVKFGSRLFRIESVITPKEIASEMQLMCREAIE